MAHVCTYTPMQSLYEAACAVLRGRQPAEVLERPIQELEAMCRFRQTETGARIVGAGRDTYVDGACDIDIDDATVIYDNNASGWWVMAWCFVRYDEVGASNPLASSQHS